MGAADVIAGNAKWSCECADALEWLRSLPDDSVDLLFTSPPYEHARAYGIKDKMKGGQDWVDWMVEVFRSAAPKVKGLIAMNCEGQTRGYRYSCVPFLLMADLHRAGFNLRKPPVFHRVGIPGSGGPDWLRNDYEPIVCVTREGKLPWSDNTACGKPPKWEVGGEMSYRNGDGVRKNDRHRVAMKIKKEKRAPEKQWGGDEVQYYQQPEIANPGNIVKCITGGGNMGHAVASTNEAPFPLDLPAFFIKSFAPPDGIVADCFSGSGTTIDAAVQNGRRGIGCDVRQSQVDLCHRRMSTVTPAMFA